MITTKTDKIINEINNQLIRLKFVKKIILYKNYNKNKKIEKEIDKIIKNIGGK